MWYCVGVRPYTPTILKIPVSKDTGIFLCQQNLIALKPNVGERLTPTFGGCQCSLSRGSVPRPILLPSINIAVRKTPYSAIWCMRYSDT